LEFLLYLLVFFFGYFTHKVFNDYHTAKASAIMFLHTKLTSVLILVRVLEQYNYVKGFGALQLKKKGASDKDVSSYELLIQNDIEYFKKSSIKKMNDVTPEHLKIVEHFEDWNGAMQFMVKYRAELFKEHT